MLGQLKSRIVAALPAAAQRHVALRQFARNSVRGEPEIRELSRIVRASDVAIDVGGNVGAYTFALSKLAKRVITFEPNPQLARRLEALRLPNVKVMQFALSASDGNATLTIPDWPEGHGFGTLRASMLPKNTSFKTCDVPVRTLDSFAFERVDFIKIDVEGLEEEVLEGAMATLTRDHPAILVELVEHFNAGTIARVRDRLGALDYQGYFFLGGWQPLAAFDLSVHQNKALRDERRHLPRDQWQYINNFLFLPSNRSIGI